MDFINFLHACIRNNVYKYMILVQSKTKKLHRVDFFRVVVFTCSCVTGCTKMGPP